MEASIFSVTAKAIVAMNLFRSEEGGGHISGINIRPDGRGGSLLVALNGHQAALLHEPFSECHEEVTITPSKAFIKALKEVAAEPVSLVRYDGERLSLCLDEATLMDQHDSCVSRDSDPFPRLSFVDAAEKNRAAGYKAPSITIPFDGMKPFQAVAKLYGGDKSRALTMYPSGAEAPCLVRMDCNVDFLGVVMPMMLSSNEEAEERTDALAGFEGLMFATANLSDKVVDMLAGSKPLDNAAQALVDSVNGANATTTITTGSGKSVTIGEKSAA